MDQLDSPPALARWGLTVVLSLLWLLIAISNGRGIWRERVRREPGPSIAPFVKSFVAWVGHLACPLEPRQKLIPLLAVLVLDAGSVPFLSSPGTGPLSLLPAPPRAATSGSRRRGARRDPLAPKRVATTLGVEDYHVLQNNAARAGQTAFHVHLVPKPDAATGLVVEGGFTVADQTGIADAIRLEIINPLLAKRYPSVQYQLKHAVGIDGSELHAARTGVRGANDLVWVGPAANYAAKLSDLSSDYPSRITKTVYDRLRRELKFLNGRSIWEAATWTDMNNLPIYRSTWWWRIE